MPEPSQPLTLTWTDAPRRLLAAAEALLVSRPGVVVGVTGPVGAGKSLLASRLSSCIVRTDDYLPDYERVAYLERDRPEHADLARLALDLAGLRAGRSVSAPVWSFHTHRRESERQIDPARIVVCEGIHALAGTVLEQIDVRVFVEAPAGVRWSRWEDLERTGQRGWGVAAAREYFDQVAEPTFGAVLQQYLAAAHFVVVNSGNQPPTGAKHPSHRGS